MDKEGHSMKNSTPLTYQMKRALSDKKQVELKSLKRYAILIEKTLESYGLVTRVMEVNILPDSLQYCLDIALGSDTDKLLRHKRDLALAIASPTGTIKMEIPIPGKSYVGIYIPRWNTVQKMKYDEPHKISGTSISPLRKVAGYYVLRISEFFFNLSESIGGQKR